MSVNVQDFCKEFGLTHNELAGKLGVTRGTISNWIAGNSKMSLSDERAMIGLGYMIWKGEFEKAKSEKDKWEFMLFMSYMGKQNVKD